VLRSEIFDTSPQTETNQELSSLPHPEPLEATAPPRKLSNYSPKESRKSERGEPFLAGNSSIYSSSSLKSPKSIQLTSTPYPSTRTPSYEKRRGPFTDLFSGDFGTSKKGKERENVPGSMASHSMTSNHSIDIQEANATPLPTTFNPRLEDVISYHLKNGLPGPEILSQFLSQNDLRVVRYIIKTHCHTVVQGEFE